MTTTQIDDDVTLLPAEGHFEVQSDRLQQRPDLDVALLPAEGHFEVQSDRLPQQQHDTVVTIQHDEGYLHVLSNIQKNIAIHPVKRHLQVHGCNITSQPLPKGISKISELTLDLFNNNYHLYAHKISCSEDGLFIRAILMENNKVIFNYTYKIIGTENVRIATIVSADQVCNLYLLLAMKGDTFLCSLVDSHLGVHASIIRNAHLTNFIKTLNKIETKLGLYTISIRSQI